MSQSALARAVGLTPQAIQSLESGTAKGSRHLPRIADVLRVNTLWLAEGIDPYEATPERETVRNLSPDQLRDRLATTLDWDLPALAEKPPFPELISEYDQDQLAVYFMGKAAPEDSGPRYTEALGEFIKDIMDTQNQLVRKAVVHEIEGSHCYFESYEAVGAIERPYYVRQVRSAYAVIPDEIRQKLWPLSERVSRLGMMIVNPERIPTRYDIVIYWHRSGIGIIGEFLEEFEGNIYLRCDAASSLYAAHLKEHKQFPRNPAQVDQEFAERFTSTTSVILPKACMRELHRVEGLQFVSPLMMRRQHSVEEIIRLARRIQTDL